MSVIFATTGCVSPQVRPPVFVVMDNGNVVPKPTPAVYNYEQRHWSVNPAVPVQPVDQWPGGTADPRWYQAPAPDSVAYVPVSSYSSATRSYPSYGYTRYTGGYYGNYYRPGYGYSAYYGFGLGMSYRSGGWSSGGAQFYRHSGGGSQHPRNAGHGYGAGTHPGQRSGRR